MVVQNVYLIVHTAFSRPAVLLEFTSKPAPPGGEEILLKLALFCFQLKHLAN